jgi:hypothetical protein
VDATDLARSAIAFVGALPLQSSVQLRTCRLGGTSVITGELKGKVDRVWDAFWSGGISNPLEVIEQITYLLFIQYRATRPR